MSDLWKFNISNSSYSNISSEISSCVKELSYIDEDNFKEVSESVSSALDNIEGDADELYNNFQAAEEILESVQSLYDDLLHNLKQTLPEEYHDEVEDLVTDEFRRTFGEPVVAKRGGDIIPYPNNFLESCYSVCINPNMSNKVFGWDISYSYFGVNLTNSNRIWYSGYFLHDIGNVRTSIYYKDLFQDVRHPTDNEMLMFKLQYGVPCLYEQVLEWNKEQEMNNEN